MLHTLAHQGINRETYLRLSGRSEEETIESSKPDAETALRREAVLAAVADAESLEPTEEEMLEAVAEAAPGERISPKKLLERLKSNGRLDSLKDDLAQRKALNLVADSAKPVARRRLSRGSGGGSPPVPFITRRSRSWPNDPGWTASTRC